MTYWNDHGRELDEAALDRALRLNHCVILSVRWGELVRQERARSAGPDPMRFISGRPEMEPGYPGPREVESDLVRRVKAELAAQGDAPLENSLVGLRADALAEDEELDEAGIDNTLAGLRARSTTRVPLVAPPLGDLVRELRARVG